MNHRMDCSNLPAYVAEDLLKLGSREEIQAELDEMPPAKRSSVRLYLNIQRIRAKKERIAAEKSGRLRP